MYMPGERWLGREQQLSVPVIQAEMLNFRLGSRSTVIAYIAG
jgi:hypothetical protein